ncbi:Yippee family protein [Colletotrichum plurivorum]|uniref:Yippee family protein n=1 Tax=Colletotrichum plurivorum TaxID=2175906 RepID=A0A8H6K6G8_9PEZI|nr:Yippee family protein [Colletotrichum plurivorum]
MAPNIVVSRPTFPVYLLPNISLPFRRPRRARAAPSTAAPSDPASETPDASQVPSLSSSPTSSTTDETVTPPSYQGALTSPPSTTTTSAAVAALSKLLPNQKQLARTQPDTLRCSTCSSDVAFSSQIVSKGFTGRYGRAYLVAATPLPPGTPPPRNSNSAAGPGTLANVRIGKCENRQLVTGWHVVADITCALCGAKLGWKYVDAKELSQKYKVGKFILEVERVVPFRSWEDLPPVHASDEDDKDEVADVTQPDKTAQRPASDEAGPGSDGESSEPEDVEVVFDSEDEDDLEDMFSGTWDPEVVAKRRSRKVTAAAARKK